MIGLVVERFLLAGALAWVVAIVLGVGAHFRLWAWRRHWTLAGALAGAGTFCLYATSGALGYSLMQLTGGLFVGSGIALAYGTLFLSPGSYRPRLRQGSVEEHLWLRDTVDLLRPQRLDWLLTGALLLPGAGLVWLGVRQPFALVPVVVGFASCLGPLYAGVGLGLRHRASTRMLEELEAREALAAPSGEAPSL